MITGNKLTDDATARPATGGGIVALIFAVAVGVGAAWIAGGGLVAPPPPPPPAGNSFNW
jgi:hypothetical protein